MLGGKRPLILLSATLVMIASSAVQAEAGNEEANYEEIVVSVPFELKSKNSRNGYRAVVVKRCRTKLGAQASLSAPVWAAPLFGVRLVTVSRYCATVQV